MKQNRHEKDYRNIKLAESAIVDGKLLIRGTRAYNDRETLRCMDGCKVLSWGKIK